MKEYEYLVHFIDSEKNHVHVKRFGKRIDDVMNEFYYEYPDAFVVAVYKMLERDWGYRKK